MSVPSSSLAAANHQPPCLCASSSHTGDIWAAAACPVLPTRAKAEALESKEVEVTESDNNAEKSADGEKKEEKKKVGWFGKLRAAIGTMWSLRVPIGQAIGLCSCSHAFCISSDGAVPFLWWLL